MARKIDDAKVKAYYQSQSDSVGYKAKPSNDWSHADHDNDNIVIVEYSGSYYFAAPDPGDTEPGTLQNRLLGSSVIYEYQETPNRFLSGNADDRQAKNDKKANDKQVRNEKMAKNGKAKTDSKETTSTGSDILDFLAGELDNVNDTANALVDGYFGSITPADTSVTVVNPESSQSMDAWSTQEIALAGGAVAIAIGVVYLIAKK